MNPTLDPNDARLFYELWIPLLDYINQTYRANLTLGKMEKAERLDIGEVHVVSNFLWSHPQLIDQYLATADLPEEHRKIISGWNNFVSGKFILERHLKRGSVFISLKDEQVYLVHGIYSSWEEMFPYTPTPILLQATLIPFKGRIIYDSIVSCSNVSFGRGYADSFKEIYLTAKQAKAVRISL